MFTYFFRVVGGSSGLYVGILIVYVFRSMKWVIKGAVINFSELEWFGNIGGRVLFRGFDLVGLG